MNREELTEANSLIQQNQFAKLKKFMHNHHVTHKQLNLDHYVFTIRELMLTASLYGMHEIFKWLYENYYSLLNEKNQQYVAKWLPRCLALANRNSRFHLLQNYLKSLLQK